MERDGMTEPTMKEKGRPLQEGSSVRYVSSYHGPKPNTTMEYEEIKPAYPYAVKALRREIARLNALVEDLNDLIAGHNMAVEARDARLGPELPNGEGVADCPCLTESAVLQGREPPRGCEPASPGDGEIIVRRVCIS